MTGKRKNCFSERVSGTVTNRMLLHRSVHVLFLARYINFREFSLNFLGKCLGHMPTIIMAPLCFTLCFCGFIRWSMTSNYVRFSRQNLTHVRPIAPFWKYFLLYFAVSLNSIFLRRDLTIKSQQNFELKIREIWLYQNTSLLSFFCGFAAEIRFHAAKPHVQNQLWHSHDKKFAYVKT